MDRLSILLVVCLLGGALPSAGQRPNFLVVVVDDQSPFDLQAYEPRSPLQTRTLERLAAEGMTIDGAYHMGSWSGAVCLASRQMLMSGRTLWHVPGSGTDGALPDPRCPSDLADHTLGAVFGRAGYDTLRTCKVGNSYAAANERFEVRREATRRGASDEEGSAWHAQQVLDHLDARAEREDRRPFLIYLGFSHPHDPRWASDELLDLYGAENAGPGERVHPRAPALPVNYLPAHPFDHGHPGLRDEVAVQGVGERRDEATVRNELGRHYACSQNIDLQLGRVLERLEQSGELDDTYVVYTSDHGIAVGRHGLMGKQNLYEHSWRVPLIVRGPGIEAGARARGNVYLLDLLATLCELAGIEAPATSEGLSFAPVLAGERESVREVLYGAYAGGTKPGMRCVRRGDWKLIKYDTLAGAVRETQLFDLARNPDELLPEHHDEAVSALTGHRPESHQTNLAGDPRFAATLVEMEALLLAEMQRLDDPYRLWDQE